MKITLLAVTLALAGCGTLTPEALGVDEFDNAVQCIRVSVDGYFTDSSADTGRIEFPKGMEFSTLTPELAEAISDLAVKLGCAG